MDGYAIEWTDRFGQPQRREFRPETPAKLADALALQRTLATERKVILEEVKGKMERILAEGREPNAGEIPIIPGPPYLTVIPTTTRRAG